MFSFCFIEEMFSALSAVFSFGRVFVSFVLVWSFNSNGNEYNGCVSVRYNSLFISLLLSQNDVLHIRQNVNYTPIS